MVRAVVVPWLAGRGWSVAEVSVDETIRRLYPPETESPDYVYDADGAILLRRPLQQIPPAVYDAIEVCRRADGGFVFELASNECVQLLDAGVEILSGALVLALTAPVELRSQRNAVRGGSLIPDDRLRQYPDLLPDAWVRGLGEAGAAIVDVDAARPLEQVAAAVVSALEAGWPLS
jgi:hypothetical protein